MDENPLSSKSQPKTTDPQRSAVMRAVKSKDTKPELLIRSCLRKLGYRCRRSSRKLPGSPDFVFVQRRKVIFVHGCFWHGHDCKRGARAPVTNAQYWEKKISRNRARDEAALRDLAASGWHALVVWECELKHLDTVELRLDVFLSNA